MGKNKKKAKELQKKVKQLQKMFVKLTIAVSKMHLSQSIDNQKTYNQSTYDEAIKYVQDTFVDPKGGTEFLMIGDVAKLIAITTGREVSNATLTTIK